MRHTMGTVAWERAGGPPLDLPQRVGLLAGAGVALAADAVARLAHVLRGCGIPVGRAPRRVDLARWAPPDSGVAREAEAFLREVSTPTMVTHSLRTYWFSAVMADLAGARVDREALWIAALMHDTGLFVVRLPEERCFTVTGAREARRITAGWPEARQDRVAMAITSNLNISVPPDVFGPEAHWMRVGGLVDVIAQAWAVHPDNLREILARAPRLDFRREGAEHMRSEAARAPHGRFGCLAFVLPRLVEWASFGD